MRASPLCDEPGFARRLENFYREAWCRRCYSFLIVIDPRTILTEANTLLRQRRPDLAEAAVRRGLKTSPREPALHHQLRSP